MLALTFRVPVCPPGETHSPRASGTPQRTLDIRQRFSLQAMMSRKNDWPQSQQNLMPPTRRFPPPWSVDELEACFVARRLRRSIARISWQTHQ